MPHFYNSQLLLLALRLTQSCAIADTQVHKTAIKTKTRRFPFILMTLAPK